MIEYLLTEILREKFGKKRLLLTDDQRRRLAVKGKILGRRLLEQYGTLFTTDTILRWHRMLVAKKWDSSERRKIGRPRIRQVIVDLILRFAQDNTTWGYDKIQGALANVGYRISDTTVSNVLKQHGIEPRRTAGERQSWSTFLKAHWDVLAAINFTTVEVSTPRGLITFSLLFAMKLKTRRARFAGYRTSPDEAWMKQMDRNLTDMDDGFLNGKPYLLVGHDAKFCASFREILQSSDVEPVRLPPRSPNLNAHLERFFGSLKSECLDRMIFFGERAMSNAVREYLAHYHAERNHQDLNNKIIEPQEEIGRCDGTLECQQRLGGMLRYYCRRAA